MYKYLKYKHKYLQLREERGVGGGVGTSCQNHIQILKDGIYKLLLEMDSSVNETQE